MTNLGENSYRVPHVILIGNCVFHENLCSDSCTSGHKLDVAHVYYTFHPIQIKFGTRHIHKNLLHVLEFCKNLQNESSIQLMAGMYFYLYLLYLLSEQGEILFRGCEHKGVEHL